MEHPLLSLVSTALYWTVVLPIKWLPGFLFWAQTDWPLVLLAAILWHRGRVEKAKAALTIFKCPINNSMPIKMSTAHVSAGRVFKAETQPDAEVKSIKLRHRRVLTYVAFQAVLLFLNKHQKDSQPYFRPLQPTHKGSKWLISAWQCAASPHIRRPESGFPWCGWCHGAARCWRASGLSEEMLRRQNRQKVNGKHMLRNQRIYAFISCIIRIQHRPSLSLTTYIQGIKKRLKQRKKIQGGFTAVSSHTRLSKHLWCKRH